MSSSTEPTPSARPGDRTRGNVTRGVMWPLIALALTTLPDWSWRVVGLFWSGYWGALDDLYYLFPALGLAICVYLIVKRRGTIGVLGWILVGLNLLMVAFIGLFTLTYGLTPV